LGYCEVDERGPKALLKVAGAKAFRDSLTDFVQRLEKESKA